MKTARDKLNAVAINGALFVGGIVALLFQSFPMGFLAAVGVFLTSLSGGSYRPGTGKSKRDLR